jgi:hypothetical protein
MSYNIFDFSNQIARDSWRIYKENTNFNKLYRMAFMDVTNMIIDYQNKIKSRIYDDY